jgi:hypothetical protein
MKASLWNSAAPYFAAAAIWLVPFAAFSAAGGGGAA